MNSLWKDLLFLHGYLLHEQDLQWHAETAPTQDATRTIASLPQPATTTQPRDCSAASCA